MKIKKKNYVNYLTLFATSVNALKTKYSDVNLEVFYAKKGDSR